MAIASESIIRIRPYGWKPWTLLILGLLFLVSPALGQNEDAATLDITGTLAELGDDDFAVRQTATYRLLSNATLTRDNLDRLYAESVTPEQRHRLLRVARHHMIRRMIEEHFGDQAGPGSMGLSHHVVRVTGPDQVAERAGVMVVMTLPGFPAYELLEPGDVIMDYAGEPIPDRATPSQFQQMIRKHQAGEVIELLVMRNGKPVRVPFMLCQGQALGTVYDDKAVTLNEPYRGLWLAERERMQTLLDATGAAQPDE